MASTFNKSTPGVYVEEISKFPPSVAGVATAIPAFIGYTEKVPEKDPTVPVPRRISSLVEYESFFGQGPLLNVTNHSVKDDSTPPKDITVIDYNNFDYVMYDSIRLFYDNGGGICYIVSVGQYGKEKVNAPALDKDRFKKGIDELENVDEVTLLLFPDAVHLNDSDLAYVQNAALKHCHNMGDRFAILDVKKHDNSTIDNDLGIFRDNVSGNDYELRFGAAYYPYLSTVYTKDWTFKDVYNKCGGFTGALQSMDRDAYNILNRILLDINELNEKIKEENGKNATIVDQPFLDSFLTLADLSAIEQFTSDYDNETDEQTKALKKKLEDEREAKVAIKAKAITDLENEIIKIKSDYDADVEEKTNELQELEDEKDAKLADEIDQNIIDQINSEYAAKIEEKTDELQELEDEKEAKVATQDKAITDLKNEIELVTSDYNTKITDQKKELEKKRGDKKDAEVVIETEKRRAANKLRLNSIIPFIPGYSDAVNELNAKATMIPPCGAIAGIYSATDQYQGVWKAPANVSIASLSGVSDIINDSGQENMNIDSTSGKSINAIRAFSGKGILVWGARTLDGNSNEWRYVSVRRLFNFIEESVKKSTAWAVFAPNDGNTWIKIKSQIENFLFNLWRDGALAGSTPGSSYIVNVGMPSTMTADDILNGYLIVEIALAAVRPAEFIILRFSHKVQE